MCGDSQIVQRTSFRVAISVLVGTISRLTRSESSSHIKLLGEIGIKDIPSVGGKRNLAMKKMIVEVITVFRNKITKIGICGQAPSDYPDFAQFLVEQNIATISLNRDTVLRTTMAILEKENAQNETKEEKIK